MNASPRFTFVIPTLSGAEGEESAFLDSIDAARDSRFLAALGMTNLKRLGVLSVLGGIGWFSMPRLAGGGARPTHAQIAAKA